jgi:hypothetical protein
VRIRVAEATVNPPDISFRTGRQAAQLPEGVRPPDMIGSGTTAAGLQKSMYCPAVDAAGESSMMATSL